MQGRATGTEGAHRAAKYIAGQLKILGLESLGDSGYFQKVPVSMDSAAGRGGRAGSMRPHLRPSFAELDTIPAARRRTEVNVLGVIRGSDPVLKNEVVLINGHYDHLGILRPVNGDSIANGADDDASGVTAVLEIARPNQGFFTRSDNIGFARLGIVAHTLSSFNLHKDYHQVSDEVSKVDFDHMTAVINTGAKAVRLLADGPKPAWKPGGQPVAPSRGGRSGQ
jgi:hypothetical protein